MDTAHFEQLQSNEIVRKRLAKPMARDRFAVAPDPLVSALMGRGSWNLYATGEIDVTAAERLERLIAAKKIPNASAINFHSPGGSLVGGMKLGRLIRKHELGSYIGRRNTAPQRKIQFSHMISRMLQATCGNDARFVGA